MAVPKQIHQAKGLWRGKSQLNFPILPPEKRVTESESSLHIDTDAHESFATITYNWEYEGKRQEGTILVCMGNKSKVVDFAWVDSWHQNSSIMNLVGDEATNGTIKAKGSYVAGKETWGWTIQIQLTDNTLALNMDNLDPTGAAEWAVKGVYQRA